MDLDETRGAYPVFSYTEKNTGTPIDCAIPFSSEIKFNLFIRDMSKDRSDDNKDLMVVMKGAPERILSRCSKILIDGKEIDFDQFYQNEVNQANE